MRSGFLPTNTHILAKNDRISHNFQGNRTEILLRNGFCRHHHTLLCGRRCFYVEEKTARTKVYGHDYRAYLRQITLAFFHFRNENFAVSLYPKIGCDGFSPAKTRSVSVTSSLAGHVQIRLNTKRHGA